MENITADSLIENTARYAHKQILRNVQGAKHVKTIVTMEDGSVCEISTMENPELARAAR